MKRLAAAPLLVVLGWPSLACSLNPPPSATVLQESASSGPPEPSLDGCKNVWLRIAGKYHEGTLVSCTVSNPALPEGVVGATIRDGLWPPAQVQFVQVPRDSSIDIVLFDDPDTPIRLYVFAWRERLSFLDSPEQLRNESFPAARSIRWAHDLGPGRYLVTAFAHWPYAGTERSFGIEVQ